MNCSRRNFLSGLAMAVPGLTLAGSNEVAVTGLTEGTLAFTKLSGSIPKGVSVKYNPVTRSMLITGVPTADTGKKSGGIKTYVAYYQVTEKRPTDRKNKTNNVAGLNAEDPKTYFAKGICTRLVAVGMGRDSEINTKLFENAPRCPTLDKKHYRNYILLFSMGNGTGNAGTAVNFVGVIDPAGNTAKQAQYNADWSS